MSNLQYYLALNRIPQVGPKTVKKLLTRWPSLEELFALTAAQLADAGLPETLVQGIKTFDWSLVEADRQWEKQDDNHLIDWDSALYPPLLKEIANPPFVFYAKGNLEALKGVALAMVGSRKPSHTGLEHAYYFARNLAAQGLVIVSGLALGIDGQAHEGCLAADGQTIAVMATGIDRIYPSRHQNLAKRILNKGLILSEFSLSSAPIAGHFPRRNRIISGLSLATLVVEAAIRSGSLITARYALEQNRDVLAIPGSINNPGVKGCHYLLQQGAKLVTSVDDVLEEFALPLMGHKNKTGARAPLGPENTKLIKCIEEDMTTVDQIVKRSGLELGQVICALADLELLGEVTAVPGGYRKVRL